MQIQATQSRNRQCAWSEDQSIRRDDEKVGIGVCKRLPRRGGLERVRLIDVQIECTCRYLYGRFGQAVTTPRRPIRLGDD